MRIKEPIQKFSPVQTLILVVTIVAITYGTYAYMTKLKDRTILTQKIKTMLMSEKELQKLEDEKYKKELDAFDAEDDF